MDVPLPNVQVLDGIVVVAQAAFEPPPSKRIAASNDERWAEPLEVSVRPRH